MKSCDGFAKCHFLVIHFQPFPRIGIPRRKMHCFTTVNALLAKNANVISVCESRMNDGTADKYE